MSLEGKTIEQLIDVSQGYKDQTFKGMSRWVGEMYRTSKKNAGRRNIPFSLTRQEFRKLVERSGGRCMVSGIEFDCSPANGKRRPFAPSLDRIESHKGYSNANCRLVSVIVNLAMNEWGLGDLLKLSRNLVARQDELVEKETKQGKWRPVEFVTVHEFCEMNAPHLPKTHRHGLGTRTARLCFNRNLETLFVPAKRRDGSAGYSGVKAYPVAALQEVFERMAL